MTPEEVHERFRGIVAKADGTDETVLARTAATTVTMKNPETCGRCKRRDGTHTPGCARTKGCAYCRKVYPAKCHHHGGPGWDPTARKRRERLARRVQKAESPRVGPHAAALAHLDVLIEAARKRLDKLVAARKAWVAVEEEEG